MTTKDRPTSIQTGAPCTDDELSELVQLEFYVERQRWHRGYGVWVRGLNLNLSYEDRRIATGFAQKPFVVEETRNVPTFVMSEKSAQQLMDDMWAAGVRPGEKLLPPASTADAIKAHLADMRDIAFRFLGKDNLHEEYYTKGREGKPFTGKDA